jgi:hypothetical protein
LQNSTPIESMLYLAAWKPMKARSRVWKMVPSLSAQALVAGVEASGSAADRGLYAQNRWAAARFGARAGLVHPETARLVSAGELLADLLERVEPTARRLGGAGFLAGLEGIDQAGEQLALGRGSGLRALGERLVALTYDGL